MISLPFCCQLDNKKRKTLEKNKHDAFSKAFLIDKWNLVISFTFIMKGQKNNACFTNLFLERSGYTKKLFQAMNNFSGSSSFMPSCILCCRTRIFDKAKPDQESWNNCCWGNFNLSSTITTIITANTSKILFWSCILWNSPQVSTKGAQQAAIMIWLTFLNRIVIFWKFNWGNMVLKKPEEGIVDLHTSQTRSIGLTNLSEIISFKVAEREEENDWILFIAKKWGRQELTLFFLAVHNSSIGDHNSSIGDLVTDWLTN